jgi:hypothetical protein
MSARIRRSDYYYVMVRDKPGEACRLLSLLAEQGVDLLAFNAIPLGGEATQLVLFPSDAALFVKAISSAGLSPTGPQRAFLITGDDKLGAFAGIHRKLAEAAINVFSSSGVTDGRGGYGYLIHVRPEDYDRAAAVLED